jgi:branched-chain amino acid aminotransferase
MSTEHKGVHDYLDDPRNADILVSVNGALKRRVAALYADLVACDLTPIE